MGERVGYITFFNERFVLITLDYIRLQIITIFTQVYITLGPANTNSSLPNPSPKWLYGAKCGTRVGACLASREFWLAVLRTGVITFRRNITMRYGIITFMYCHEITGVRESGHPEALVMCNPHLGLGGEEHEKKC